MIVIGETKLRIAYHPGAAPVPITSSAQPTPRDASILAPTPALAKPASSPSMQEQGIVHMIDTSRPLGLSANKPASTLERRLGLLLDLPRQFSCASSQDELLQAIMTRVIEVIPVARRGALLLRDPRQDALLLTAYVSPDEPAVSQTLARRAINEKHGFLWRSGPPEDLSRSVREFQIATGLYAPIQWHDRVFGVICVDSPNIADMFQEEDLKFLIAIGQYAGMALAERNLLEDAGRHGKLVERVLANFSPKVRSVLLDQARLGKLRPSGVKSELTVLFCDICGFTRSAAQMDAHDVVDMLNNYFQPFVEAVYRHDGIVDKFVGDAMLAVFGSPEPDVQHSQKAISAAIAIQEAVRSTTQLRAARADATCQVRIGIHSGEVFHGFVGALDRLEYTVIGDAVNRASRYCEAAGEGQILISPEVFQRVFNVVRADKTTVSTKEGDLAAYRLKEIKPV